MKNKIQIHRWNVFLLLLFFFSVAGFSQPTPYPPRIVEGITWTSGTHNITVPQKIISPGSPSNPVDISGQAEVDFKSGTEIDLKDGFHAGGFSGNGNFHAHIGPSLDMILIAPDPSTHITNDVVHVEKWEKFEIGIQLPAEYQTAISNFFGNYYSNGVNNPATPGNVDPDYDLNPYADDSLQMHMVLTSPSGQKMKWGFYMKEAKWGTVDESNLSANTSSPLYPYNVRFRAAPDEVGTWYFSINISAPYTETPSSVPLASIQFTGFSFECDAPLSDNKGYLGVNATNKRILQFEPPNGDVFFGLGTNMADVGHGNYRRWSSPDQGDWWYDFFKRDFDVMQQTMQSLHSVGGNYLRMFMMRNTFSPEWVNAGVYDAYKTPVVCSQWEIPGTCADDGWTSGYLGNCQFLCWAFDKMLDCARANNIYIQLCIDPYPPIGAYEKFIWGAHPYVLKFLEPTRLSSGMYDMEEFFYSSGVSNPLTQGVFYYWKRKYKYIMSRWGYSVNIASIEPFNEIDQMLSFSNNDLRNYDNQIPPQPINSTNCNDWDDVTNTTGVRHRDICPENRFNYSEDINLKPTINNWLTGIANYVRGNVDFGNPVYSPLGEDKKLFLVSYAASGAPPSQTPANYFQLLPNPEVDLIDCHQGLYHPITEVKRTFDEDVSLRNTYVNSSTSEPKPFHNGEYGTPGYKQIYLGPNNSPTYPTSQYFNNHEVSFHNEIWASTFFGNFAAGTTWSWPRIYSWPNALPVPYDYNDNGISQPDPYNQFQLTGFSNEAGQTNIFDLDVATIHTQHDVTNKILYDHFQPLSNFLNTSYMQSILNDNNITALSAFSCDNSYPNPPCSPGNNDIESYYFINSDQTLAIGWVHSMNNFWFKHWYYNWENQHYLDCTAPNTQLIKLPGFSTAEYYYTTFYPTHPNSAIAPAPIDYQQPDSYGKLWLDLSSAPLNGTLMSPVYDIDAFHSDYAFIAVGSAFSFRQEPHTTLSSETNASEIDFLLYPNPNDKFLNILILQKDKTPKDITIFDPMGRKIYSKEQVSAALQSITTSGFAKGIYFVKVKSVNGEKVKRIIIQ
ncbi:MAG TPA: T9SS type A sorting domain-containing protein [Bacteroidia bacterium]|nr:T9SS type A sorting domain-containing protein [Bacteroidia bacterium]